MKKFYTFALAAAVAFAATATAPVQLKTLAPEKKAAANSVMETTASMVKVSHKAMAPSRADEEESITGNYTIQIGDYYFGEESIGEYEADAEIIDNGDGTITISSSEFYNAITASYDATTGEITFSQTKLGRATINNKTYYIAFEPSQWVMYDEENGDIEYNSYSATYDASTGVITFPADHGFAWIAYSDLRYSKFAGYMNLFDVLGMEKAAPAEPIDEEQAGQWKSIGNATFVDAWVIASFSINKEPVDPADFAFEAELQQNVENSNIYRLWRPYFSEGFLEIVGQNSSSYNGQIVFDVTDPDHVIVKTGLPAGWKNANGEMFNYDYLGWEINGFGDEFSTAYLPSIYEFMAEHDQPFSTFKDGVITVNASIFDFNKLCENAYSWTNAVTKVSTITFPEGYDNAGISDVEVNETGEATYYNLQGVRVSDNVKGLVIRVQNGKATKVVL